MTKIFSLNDHREQLVTGATISAGGSVTQEFNLGEYRKDVAVAFQVGTATGSPNAKLQLYYGDSAVGNPVWYDVDSSATAKALLTSDTPAKKGRILIEETGGVDQLDGVDAWLEARSL